MITLQISSIFVGCFPLCSAWGKHILILFHIFLNDVEALLSSAIVLWATWLIRNSVVCDASWGGLEFGVAGLLSLVNDPHPYAAIVYRRHAQAFLWCCPVLTGDLVHLVV